jgi:ABC-type polysaccharide/polyol phosphate transport system ATPase subunit
LLIDEALSVGDLEFQEKCMTRIEQFLHGGATLILVSHAPQTVRQLCNRVVWLEHGRVIADGAAGTVLDAFVAGDPAAISAPAAS